MQYINLGIFAVFYTVIHREALCLVFVLWLC